MSGKPNVGHIVVGLFLCLFGAAIGLAGGGCTIMLGLDLAQSNPGRDGLDALSGALVLVSVAALAVGLLCLWVGVTMFRGGVADRDAAPERGEEE